MNKLSIIIPNFNYERFVGDAIRSALAVRWSDKEVIVVDDGSTDTSRAVIADFGSKITTILQNNAGQNSAVNAGFARSSGDIIIFLDADDMLLPTVAEEVNAVWHERISKVQYGLLDLDENGYSSGEHGPVLSHRHTPEHVLAMVRRTCTYIGPPTSGNAWSRRFLELVFPLPVREATSPREPGAYFGIFFDAYLKMLAPFFGDVVSLITPQGYYRIHGRNQWQVGSTISAAWALNRCLDFARTVDKANEMRQKIGDAHGFWIDWERDEFHMAYRLIAQKLIPKNCPPARLPEIFIKYCRSVWLSENDSLHKVLYFVWAMLTLLGPRSLAEWAFKMRTSPSIRPSILRGIMRAGRPHNRIRILDN
jgi:glycosyl transferase family 2